MANLLLTEKCVRSCPYCFAKVQMDASDTSDMLSWENLLYVADFFELSDERHISLLGGEPTLHPHFVDFVLYLMRRRFHVTVFTSGVMGARKLDEITEHLSGANPEQFSIVCNINEPALSTPRQNELLGKFLDALGHLVSPGFNIYTVDFKLEFLFDMINRYGLRRSLRLGLAQPIPLQPNVCIPVEDLGLMAARLVSYLPQFAKYKIAPGMDCGFPLCVFTDEQLGMFYKLNKSGLQFGCGPAIDIGPDLSVWSCFPLSTFHARSLYEFQHMRDIGRYYQEIHSKIRIEKGGIYAKCDECPMRERGMCLGGCASHCLAEFAREPSQLRLSEVYL
jgi:hypothetical protein